MSDPLYNWVNDYIDKQKELLESLKTEEIVDLISHVNFTINSGGTIYICGNGGSLLNAQHGAEDILKGPRDKMVCHPRVIALGSNPGLVSAIANDISYDRVFSFELESLLTPHTYHDGEQDLLIGISVSGNSANVINAMKVADINNVFTIGITGNSGKNKIGKLAKYSIGLDSKHFGRVEH